MVNKKTPLSSDKINHRLSLNYRRETVFVIGNGCSNHLTVNEYIGDFAAGSQIWVITDDVLCSAYGKILEDYASFILKAKIIVVPYGESSKTLDSYEEICSKIIEDGEGLKPLIIGFGGGLIGNVAGMVAATLRRGVNLVHIPTTLMAQADAAIDVKQALNLVSTKNQIGAIYSPTHVFVDPKLLETLDKRQINNGYSEILKHAFCQENCLLDLLRKSNNQSYGAEALMEILNIVIPIKIDLVKERESGSAKADAIMQYGHSVAHSLESCSDYNFLHGEALGVGMRVCAELSYSRGLISLETRDSHVELIDGFSLPISVDSSLIEGIKKYLARDKAFHRGFIRTGLVVDKRNNLTPPERDIEIFEISIEEYEKVLLKICEV